MLSEKMEAGIELLSVVLFRVEVGTVDGGIGGATSAFAFEEFVGGFGAETLEERFFEFLEEEGERAADDEEFGRFLFDDVEEAEGEASEEVFEGDVVENEILEGVAVVGFDESFGGGNIFPFEVLVVEGVFDVARFESVRGF